MLRLIAGWDLGVLRRNWGLFGILGITMELKLLYLRILTSLLWLIALMDPVN
jgi:hypothetical protein